VNLSIVIPLYNEDESLPELAAWIHRVCTDSFEANFAYEIIMIDDGSTDDSWAIVQRLAAENPAVRGIKFRRNYGKSAALHEGFKATKGKVVITMDADLQDSPDEIPALYQMIVQDKYDLVSGWKSKRYDPLSKTIPTKIFNWATRQMSGIHNLHDFNCGLKAYRREVVKSIEIYGEMHRYIPVIAKTAGFKKIGEKTVQHQARKYGYTKFGGWERFINGVLDLLSISFVGTFGKRPIHIFGSLGILSFAVGVVILSYLSLCKILYAEYGIATRPLFFFGILAIIFGMQLFVGGFLAELVVRNAPDRNLYHIEEVL
jgi:glycosyltransferase involved in cell wall biosynthesis